MMHSTTSVICLVAVLSIALMVPSAVATVGPLAQATVSFGQWQTDPAFDRFTVPNDRTRNDHLLIPQTVTIRAGGAVNFIISGFHEPVVYDDGTEPEAINAGLLVPSSSPPGLIDDPDNRIFRGVDPRTVPQDRVESIRFREPGTYLVICAVHPHFVNDKMFGFVQVLP